MCSDDRRHGLQSAGLLDDKTGRPETGRYAVRTDRFEVNAFANPLNCRAPARAFVKDMRAFHAAKTGFERDEIAARQLHALREYQRPGEKPIKLAHVHELFLAMREALKL